MTTEDKVEKLRAGLLSATVDRKKKLGLLKKLVEFKTDPRVIPILKEAAAAPVNQSILGYVVRSFGYLSGPAPLAELTPYLSHPGRVVVGNAMKALVAVDKKEAVRLGLAVVRGPTPETAVAAARVLAERCHAECQPVFAEMAASSRPPDRYAALLYLRFLPAAEALPILLEMLRRETDPELYPVIARVLPKIVPKSQSGPVEALRSELAAKLVELDAALDTLSEGNAFALEAPEEADPEFPDALLTTDYLPTRKRDTAEPLGAIAFSAPGSQNAALASGGIPTVKPPGAAIASGGLLKAVKVAAAALQSGEVPAVRPPPEALQSGGLPQVKAPPEALQSGGIAQIKPSVAPASAGGPAIKPPAPALASGGIPAVKPPAEPPAPAPATAAPPPPPPPPPAGTPEPAPAPRPEALVSAQNAQVPWQKKQLRKQQERLRHVTRALKLDQIPGFTRKSPMLSGSILTVVCYVAFLIFGRGGAVTPPPKVSDIVEGQLGRVGAKIKFTGTLIEVNRDYNILLVRDERQLVVSAYYQDQPVGNFTKGKRVAIEGTIREIKSERAYVVHGITASQS